MRVYLPATLPLLERWVAAGQAEPAGPAHAVTPALREAYRDGDQDDLEELARDAAARGAVELLAHDLAVPRQRVVVVADVEDAAVGRSPDDPRSQVQVVGAVPARRWACALVDDPSAARLVASAVAQLARAALGDDDAQFALDELDAVELGWYAVQELPHRFGPAGS